MLGYRQHGSNVSLRVADLAIDATLAEWAHEDALALLDADPSLSGDDDRPLALEVRDRFPSYFEEMERA